MRLIASVNLVPPLDHGTPLVGVAGSDRKVVRRITKVLRRDGIEVAAVATTLHELVLGTSDLHMRAAVFAAGDLADVEPAIDTLRRRTPDAHLVVVIRDFRGPMVKRAIDLGVAGLVAEHDTDFALSPTVAAVCAGQIAVPRESSGQLAYPLTTRERDVIELIQGGLTNRQIAGRLHLAESTVKSHVSAAFAKLGVRSRKETQALELEDLEPPRRPTGD